MQELRPFSKVVGFHNEVEEERIQKNPTPHNLDLNFYDSLYNLIF